jgi:hypothetical protein
VPQHEDARQDTQRRSWTQFMASTDCDRCCRRLDLEKGAEAPANGWFLEARKEQGPLPTQLCLDPGPATYFYPFNFLSLLPLANPGPN